MSTNSRLWLPINLRTSTIGFALDSGRFEFYWKDEDVFRFTFRVPLWLPALLFGVGLLLCLCSRLHKRLGETRDSHERHSFRAARDRL